MLMGFGATGQVWAPQLADLLAAKVSEAAPAAAPPALQPSLSRAANMKVCKAEAEASFQSFHGPHLLLEDETGESPMLVCIMDNRGVGRSSCPCGLRHYSTEIMAKDALAVVVRLSFSFLYHLIIVVACAKPHYITPFAFPPARGLLSGAGAWLAA